LRRCAAAERAIAERQRKPGAVALAAASTAPAIGGAVFAIG
jgi:hypothetical protein